MASLREQILAAEDLPREQVPTDEWAPFGVPFVHVRGLSASERDDYEQTLVDVDSDGNTKRRANLHNVRAGLAARVIVDEAGERIFTDKDVNALGQKNAAVLDRICDKALQLSGMSPANPPSATEVPA
jgi:hypothetical protein